MKIIFYGTAEFAVASLEILIENGKEVVAVVTAPDKPAGRGRQLKMSDVKEAALRHNIPVLQPVNLKDPEFHQQLRQLNPDIQIVVAFRMMPEAVWNLPRLGTFNLHASLLPQYRGAAPINWAIINGENKTGVTTFFLQHEIDTGNIIFSQEVPIDPDENVSSLHDRMKIIGAQLVLKTINEIEKGTVQTHPQTTLITGELKSAPKLNKENTKIDFSKSAREINNLIRGLSYYPGAHAELVKADQECVPVKIFKAAIQESNHSHEIGTTQTDGKTFLKIFVKNGTIDILEMQLPGKSRMKIKEILNGNRTEGWRFQ